MCARITLASFFLLLGSLRAAAQADSALEQRMTRRVLTCDDIVLNASTLLPRYVRMGARDSVEAVLRFYDQRCAAGGGRASIPLYSFRLLYAVDTGNADPLIDGRSLGALFEHKWLMDGRYRRGADRWDTVDVDAGYYAFLQDYGAELAGRPGKTPTSQWIARLFASGSDSSAYAALQQPPYRDTRLGQAYAAATRPLPPPAVLPYGSAIAGMQLLRGPLEALGDHPLLGFSIGAVSRRWIVEMPLQFAFGNTRRDYVVLYDGNPTQTRYYQTVHVGLRADYAFFQTRHLEFSVNAGGGYESLTAIKDPTPRNGVNDAKIFPTLNLNAGFTVRHYVNDDWFVGLTGSYNRLSYRNPSGTDLTGNTLTVGVVFGGAPGFRALRQGAASN